MSERYPGGFINRSAPVVVGPTGGEGGSAPGVWTLEQASYYISQGTWPKPLLPRTLWVTGDNTYGQIGDNTVINRSSPTQVSGGNSWSAVAVGFGFNVAVDFSGKLWGFGTNGSGQIGDGSTVSRSAPVQIGSLTTWSVVKAGTAFAMALKTDGTLWSWGSNDAGQLGNNIGYVSKSSPVQIGSDTNWANIACGGRNGYAVRTTGTLWSWGDSTYGALGLNQSTSFNYKSSPTQIGALTTWSKAFGEAGSFSAMAVKTDGTLWAWGYNLAGRLGDNSVANRSSPVQIGALTNWSSAAPGQFASYGIKTDGTFWSWGTNTYGELALNNGSAYVFRSSPVQVGSLTNWSSVRTMTNGFMSLKTDGTIWGCGRNNLGQLGTGTSGFTNNFSSPVQIGSGTNWQSIGAGSSNSAMISKG